MANKTKGSVLYGIDPETDEMIILDKITAMDLGNASATTTDIQTWGDRTTRPIRTGMELSECSVTLYPSSDNPLHKRLYELSQSTDTDGPEMKLALGWSDGNEAPTVTAGEFELPTTRTFFTFSGWVSSFPLDFSGDVVQTQLMIQRTDLGKWVAKEVA